MRISILHFAPTVICIVLSLVVAPAFSHADSIVYDTRSLNTGLGTVVWTSPENQLGIQVVEAEQFAVEVSNSLTSTAQFRGIETGYNTPGSLVPVTGTVVGSELATALAVGTSERGEKEDPKPGDVRSGIVVTSEVTSMPVSRPAPLPPGLTYCDSEPCASTPPLVLYVCPTGDLKCTPTRSTTIIPRVDGRTISGLSLSIFAPNNTSIHLSSYK